MKSKDNQLNIVTPIEIGKKSYWVIVHVLLKRPFIIVAMY